MARRGENIYKRADGRFEGRYIKGRTENGKAVYGYIYGRKYKEVKTKLIQLKAGSEAKQQVMKAPNKTVHNWLAYWLEEFSKPNIKQSTYASYYGTINRYILPALGEKQLEKLTREEIQQFINTLISKGLGSTTIRGVFCILNAAFKEAVKNCTILNNPCSGVILPRHTRINIDALTTDEQKALEQSAIQDKNGSAVILALYTGMRIGEICALKWEDVDFSENMIRVRHTVQRVPNLDSTVSRSKILFGTPKSESSYRSIPITGNMVDYLLTCKEKAESDYVISCKGSFAEPRVVEYRFKKLLAKAEIRQVHFHALRHTFATRCMEMNIDITTLSRLLGHTSVKMTLDIYTDSVMEQRRAAVLLLDKLFTGTVRQNFI